MKEISKNIQKEFGSFIGRLFRTQFGKGPESVYVTINESYVSIYLGNFLSPLEKALLDQHEERVVHQTRDIILQKLLPEISEQFEREAGMKIEAFYYDWNLENRSGMILGRLSEGGNPFSGTEDYEGKRQAEELMASISERIQKRPMSIESLKLNQRILLIKRSGVLTMLERELMETDMKENLRYTKKKLERTILFNNAFNFESILNQKVDDIFVDWDFSKDISKVLIILHAKRINTAGNQARVYKSHAGEK
ncbi:DUF2294 domain-containing protein [Peribacillus sp. SCS-26]|uniref:DUF2294 domain-containing protein n=1 Tax=Paraperibacillus marinus TaxID=3115295 RepID=UPI003905BC62